MSIGYQPPTNARPSDRTTSRPYARRESLQNLDTVPTPTHPDALHYFGVLYAGLRGWCELSWIIGDPAQKDGHSYHKEWHEVTTEYTTLAARCATLAALYGNVYVSRTLYSEQRRSVDCAVPSHVIFVDDLPAAPALAPSMVIQTSAKSRHGYYLTTEPLANADGNELARRGAAALGCDPSGADITQIVRVPGTFNTKHGGRFPVQLSASGGTIYHADALRAAWPELATPDVAPLKLNNQRVKWFLGNINTLLDHEGIPRRIRNPKARALFTKRGQWPDTSTYRYTIAKSLVMHGFPDDEAAALLIHLCEPASARKGGAWLVTDTQRCLVKTRSKTTPYHGIRATTLSKKYQAQLPQALPAQPPQRVGRPNRATADALLAFYQHHADSATHCLMNRAAVCSALNIGGSTVARLEKKLTQRGAIHRQTAPNRRSSWIVFGAKPADLGLSKITKNTPENAPTANNFGNTPIPLESHKAEAGITKEHTAPVAPPAAAVSPPLAQPSAGVCSFKTPTPTVIPSLAMAVAAVLSTSARRVDANTGEITGKLWTLKRVTAALVATYGNHWGERSIATAYHQVRKQKKTAAFADYQQRVAAMPTAALAKEAGAKAKTAVRSAGKPREAYHRAMDAIAQHELARRANRPARRVAPLTLAVRPVPAPQPEPVQPASLVDVPVALLIRQRI